MNTTHTVAVLENVGKTSSRWLWLRHSPVHCKAQARPPSVVVASTARGGWGRGGYTSAGAGMQQAYEELCASTQQEHNELYAGTQQRHKEFLIMRYFSNLAS